MSTNAAIADNRGMIFAHPGLEAAGEEGGVCIGLTKKDLIELPERSKFFTLPLRMPVGYDRNGRAFAAIEGYFAVAAFLPPGYTVTHTAAYKEEGRPKILPLFSYAAVAFLDGRPYTAAIRVDRDIRHDQSHINIAMVKKGIKKLRKILPKNRLVRHLENCALVNSCPNAQNFFLSRFEAPLVVSPACNAACLGCISYQPYKSCPETQVRIKFVPKPEEVGEVALFHINNVRNAVVSFGQGCEGEPLLEADVIERSIKLIRSSTKKGTININTNGSRPGALARLFAAGLDSCRISMNSAQGKYYARYYRPRGYAFRDVLKSIDAAKRAGGFVSINYLTMPGFTDSRDEFEAFRGLISKHRIDMIQWRNLNFDPRRYFEILGASPKAKELLGIRNIMRTLKSRFPHLKSGYFNPSI